MAPKEGRPAGMPGRQGQEAENSVNERLVFDLCGIDWVAEESIRSATRQIWVIKVAIWQRAEPFEPPTSSG